MGNSNGIHRKSGSDSGSDTAPPSDTRVTETVCSSAELGDGQMREVKVGNEPVLVARTSAGRLCAIGARCTHYGAPLVKGALCDERVRCPWHGASFNLITGDIEDFPGLDSLQSYDVSERDGDVVITGMRSTLSVKRRIKPMSRGDDSDSSLVHVIVGGGASAITCAETWRQEGFRGRIRMLTKEQHPPYDRPKLSKMLDAEPAKLYLRDPDFYQRYDIEVETGCEVTAIDTSTKTLTLHTGDDVRYDKVVIATGGRPRRLDSLPGADADGVFVLRSPDDGRAIASRARDAKAVVIGSSFIAMEVASYLSGKASNVTLLCRGDVPFRASLGDEVGALFKRLAESKGITFVSGQAPREFKVDADSGRLTAVITDAGTEIAADVCVLGVGVQPATDFLRQSNIPLTSRGHVIVDSGMRTAVPGVYAAGDIVEFPMKSGNDEHRVNIGHWGMAHAHGRVAALSSLGRDDATLNCVPFFWTMQLGVNLRYAGHCSRYDRTVVEGSVEERKFVVYYVNGGRVEAVATMGRDPVAAAAAEAFRIGIELGEGDVGNGSAEETWMKGINKPSCGH